MESSETDIRGSVWCAAALVLWPLLRKCVQHAATWSANANIKWIIDLPGPRAFSPIVVGDQIFVTCDSGYGLTQDSPGEIDNLTRHLVSVNLNTGKIYCQADVKAGLPEDPYSGVGSLFQGSSGDGRSGASDRGR